MRRSAKSHCNLHPDDHLTKKNSKEIKEIKRKVDKLLDYFESEHITAKEPKTEKFSTSDDLRKKIEEQDILIKTQQAKIDEVLKHLNDDKAKQDEYNREKRGLQRERQLKKEQDEKLIDQERQRKLQLEKDKQIELERQKTLELEKQKRDELEKQRQYESEKQRKHELELRKQQEFEDKIKAERELKRKKDLEILKQQEDEQRKLDEIKFKKLAELNAHKDELAKLGVDLKNIKKNDESYYSNIEPLLESKNYILTALKTNSEFSPNNEK